MATAAAVWAAAPQRAAQAIDRLLALRLVRAPHHSQMFGSCSVQTSVSPPHNVAGQSHVDMCMRVSCITAMAAWIDLEVVTDAGRPHILF